MRTKTNEMDRSRNGKLIHEATPHGRCVSVVAYIESALQPPGYAIETEIICRTSEQAAEVARVLNEARFIQPERT